MSLQIESLNQGKIEKFGYNRSDVSKVRLGELPPLSSIDFARYAGNTLMIALEGQSDELKDSIAKTVNYRLQKIVDLPIREDAPLSFSREVIMGLEEKIEHMHPNNENAAALRQMVEEIEGSEYDDIAADHGNPFTIVDDNILIGEKYLVSVKEFAYFTSYALAGGHFGWGNRGVPRVALDALTRIQESLKILQPV